MNVYLFINGRGNVRFKIPLSVNGRGNVRLKIPHGMKIG